MIPQPQEVFQSRTLHQRKADDSIKTREIMVPTEEARDVHEQMLRMLYSFEIPMPYATGGVPGRSLLDNVMPHRHNDHFYMLDLKDAFANVDIDKLVATAKTPLVPARHEFDIETFILDWATTPEVRGLPLGAPCSPFLFNLYCLPLDNTLGQYCEQEGITYTRYLDDLTFSAPGRLGKRKRQQLRGLIEAYPGVAINHAKSKVHSLENGPVTITGVSVYPDRRVQPAPHLIDAARKVFAEAEHTLAAGGQLSDELQGRLHGWRGVLEQLATTETPVLCMLDTQYRRAVGGTGLKASAPPLTQVEQLRLF